MAETAQMKVSDEVAIRIDNMNKWYGAFHVLRDINLTVHRGERIVICGPSGSGKSTQVPQYLLEDMCASGRGGECSIVVTQPRRIAAIALAERVATERGGGKAGGGPPSHSGKLLHTEPRFRDVVKKDSHVTPAPGSYRPRYTLTESRHNI